MSMLPSLLQFQLSYHMPLPFSDVSNIEIFTNQNFKRWQEWIFSLFDVHGVAHALLHYQPGAYVDNKSLSLWQYANKVCRHII
uniref:Putative ovule protein n=1 Tax=Solanum chacoense TaxID=4108 RepID=A0A0V0HCE7_SOLCH